MHDKEIRMVLRDIGVPTHLKGFASACACVQIVLEHPDYTDNFIRDVYGAAARELGSSVSRVERSIRNAVSYVFKNTDVEVLERYFGHTISINTGKVTNKCFITTIADCIKMEVKWYDAERFVPWD